MNPPVFACRRPSLFLELSVHRWSRSTHLWTKMSQGASDKEQLANLLYFLDRCTLQSDEHTPVALGTSSA